MAATTKADETRWQTQLEKARKGKLSLDDLQTFKQELFKAGKVYESLEVSNIESDQLKQENGQLKQEKTKLEYAAAKTIRTIYRPATRPTFPPLEMNPRVVPSIEGHHLKDMQPQRAAYTRGICDNKIWSQLGDVVVPTEILGEGNIARFITSQFDPQQYPLRYENEFKVQVHVDSLVKDAIACMGCNGILDTNLEISMYGVKPDIIVVQQGRKMLFVIEVKSPNRVGKQDDVCDNELVGGQIWLYLMTMKQFGVKRPLGAICTFNQIRLVSLEDMANHPFTDALLKLNHAVATQWDVGGRIDSKDQPSPDPKRKKCVSTVSKRFEYKHPAETFADGEELEGGGKVFKARLYGSNIANTADVFPLLLLGLTTAKIDMDSQNEQPESISEAHVGVDLGSRQYAYATETTLGFARTPSTLKVIAGHPSDTCTTFYLLDTLGTGDQGDVCLAASTGGACGAIKFYHIKPSREATPEDRKEQNERSIQEATVERDKEMKRWNELYPNRMARAITLRGLPCLLMEYGIRIPQKEQKKSLDDIKKEMIRFLEFRNEETMFGYAYKETDLRWRHVLRDRDGKIFLADLGSLEKLKEVDASTVEKQIEYLGKDIHVACDGDEAKKKAGSTTSSKKRVGPNGKELKRKMTG